MGTDRRLSRHERSGRYGSDGRRGDLDWYEKRNREGDFERDFDRGWGDDRHRERFPRHRLRDSPERGQKRRSSDRSDDEWEGDYPEQHYNKEHEEASKTIMLRGLSLQITEDDIRTALEKLQGPQPVDIRLMNKKAGSSRGFAFVEFYHLQDSTRWMETNQNRLMIHGRNIEVQYSNRSKKFENWLCGPCGLYNFRKRLTCYRCGTSKPGESSGSTTESRQPTTDFSGDTLILRNIGLVSTADSILKMLAPYVNLPTKNVRLIKDRRTGHNRGFAFVQLSSPLEASQLLTVLQSLQPPLKLDGKTICVDYAKNGRKDSVQPEGTKSHALSVASTAIAAAQWSSTQLQQSSGTTCDYTSQPESYAQQAQNSKVWAQQAEGVAQVAGDGLLGAATGAQTVIPPATGVVISQEAQVYKSAVTNQPAVQPHQLVSPTVGAQQSRVSTTSLATPASSTNAVTVSAAPTAGAAAVPDTSTYQYDESSGYYYDPQTGLYYDPSSQYYYNPETQQYLYWNSEKQTYVQATAESDTNTEQANTAACSSTTVGSKEPKEKKEKPKSKSAQQIAKDMERWAKTLNKQKEIVKSSSQPSKEEDRKGSATADAGFSLFEKKIGGMNLLSLMNEQFRIAEQEMSFKSDLVAAYNGDSDPEENWPDLAAEEEKITDWKKMVCLLCRRQFPNKEALLRHQQLSDLHQQNLEIKRRSRLSDTELEELEMKEVELKYRDRAAERREKYGVPEPSAPPKKKFSQSASTISFEQPTKDGLTSNNIGNKMLQAMGWQEGKGLGRRQQGITVPVSVSIAIHLAYKNTYFHASSPNRWWLHVNMFLFALKAISTATLGAPVFMLPSLITIFSCPHRLR
ncbi:RNA-binding protein 5-like isoform 2-T2 [Pholidichthys leucotaenia]